MSQATDWKRDTDGRYLHLQFDSDTRRQTKEPRYGMTASGYGGKLPTRWMVKPDDSPRWHRVYVACYSNAGSAYIRLHGEDVLVDL